MAADTTPEVQQPIELFGGKALQTSPDRRLGRHLRRHAEFGESQRGTWLHTSEISGRRVTAFDGKTLRGAHDRAGKLVHLLAGLCQSTGTVLAQLAVGAKTNEIRMLTKLLDTIDITDIVITADALHCQRGTPSTSSAAAATTSSPSKTTRPSCENS